MTSHEWLNKATQQLKSVGIGTARLDCLVLLEDVTSKDRTHLLAHPDTPLTAPQLDQLEKLLARRAKHEPLAYIRERTEFYGRTFYINHSVLEPRPESETMIELLQSLELPKSPIIIDIGTGSGALAITAQLETPASKVTAIDIDPHCLDVSRQNADRLKAQITLLESDLLAALPIQTEPFIILANLPYVPDSYHINQAAMEEPRIAIFGGPDGLDLYRHMFEQIGKLAVKPQSILTESLPFQHHALATIARAHGYTQTQKADFIQGFYLD